MTRALLLFFGLLSLAARGQGTGTIRLQCNWADTTGIRISAGLNARFNDVWGLTWGGREYGVIGSTEGTHVIDVATLPAGGVLPGRRGGRWHHPPRLQDVQELPLRRLRRRPEHPAGVRLFHPARLAAPRVGKRPAAAHAVAHHLHRHRESPAVLRLGGGPGLRGRQPPHLFSGRSRPPGPHPPPEHAGARNRTKVHALYARNDTAYLSCSYYGYVIAQVFPTDSIRVLGGTTTYPYKGYSHSCWVGPDGIGVMADETHGFPMKVIQTQPLPYTDVRSLFSPCSGDTCVPHNPYVIGTTALISHYFQGLVLYDITNPDQPVFLGSYDTYPGPAFPGFSGAWGCYPFLPSGKVLISDMQTGLYVLDVSELVRLGTETAPRASAFRVFPNPATDRLQLVWPTAPRASVQVLDLTGRVLLAEALPAGGSGQTLPLPPSWPPGLYLVRMQAGDQVHTTRFLKTP